MKKDSLKQRPNFAIVTRTKNRNLLLKRALDSVAAQTYRDFIHVIINDGGDRQGVDKLVSGYDHKIKLIHNSESKGLTGALNQGVRAVDSRYVSILDDDDSWHPDRLKYVDEHLEKTGSRGVVCVTDIVVETIQGNVVSELSRSRLFEGLTYISLYKQCIDNYMTNGCFTYLREVYEELGGYDEGLSVAEDWDFGIRFLLKYDIDYLLTEQALYFYHHRPDIKGDIGNSVFDRAEEHRKHVSILANHYLREDIKSGNFGIGYIMNSLLYRRENIVPYEEKRQLDHTIRIEGHMDKAAKTLQEELTNKLMTRLRSAIKNRINPFRRGK